jgi:hypothetical protein
MHLLEFSKLTTEQKADVVAMYPTWGAAQFGWFRFMVRDDGKMSRAKGRHEMTEEGYRASLLQGNSKLFDPVRSKGDLREWKGAPTFHLDRSPLVDLHSARFRREQKE